MGRGILLNSRGLLLLLCGFLLGVCGFLKIRHAVFPGSDKKVPTSI